MTTQTRLSTKGFEEYLERIAKAGLDIDAAADKALLAGCKVVQEEMISLAPKKTLNLVKHIQIKGPIRDGTSHTAEVGVIHESAFTDARTAIYANAQEYGSVKNAAHPYIRPGIANSANRAKKAMRDSLIEDGAI